MTIAEFLLARIAEDEIAASTTLGATWNKWMERDLEAKRRIVSIYSDNYYRDAGETPVVSDAARMVRALALPYADHPDYDETWRP